MAGLKKLKEKYEIVLDVRGQGLMFAIELTWPSSFTKKLQWQMIDKVSKGLLAQAVVIPLYRQYGIISMVSGKRSHFGTAGLPAGSIRPLSKIWGIIYPR